MEEYRLEPSGHGLLGLARRAGALIVGVDQMRERVKRGQTLLILADPALSERTWRELEGWQEADGRTRVVALAEMVALNGLLGTNGVRAVALADGGFRRGLEERLSPLNTGEQGGCQEA
jgi:ribosomal protein L7Ae-like RNA K-turn-binding protein